jgi:hypothetical protein
MTEILNRRKIDGFPRIFRDGKIKQFRYESQVPEFALRPSLNYR